MSPRPSLDGVVLLRVAIVWVEADETGDGNSFAAVWSSVVEGRVRGRPGPLFSVFRRGSDGLCVCGGSGFLTIFRISPS